MLLSAGRLILPSGTSFDLNSGLEFLHLLVGGVTAAKRNWAIGGDDATVEGTPTEHSGYISLQSGVNCLRTKTPDMVTGTLACIARPTSDLLSTATQVIPVGSYIGSTSSGSAMTYTQSTFGLVAYNTSGNVYSARHSSVVGPAQGVWDSSIVDFDAGGSANSYNMTAGTSGSAASNTGDTRATNGANYGIGSGGVGLIGYRGTVDIMAAAGWSRRLNDAERAAWHGLMQQFASKYSITI